MLDKICIILDEKSPEGLFLQLFAVFDRFADQHRGLAFALKDVAAYGYVGGVVQADAYGSGLFALFKGVVADDEIGAFAHVQVKVVVVVEGAVFNRNIFVVLTLFTADRQTCRGFVVQPTVAEEGAVFNYDVFRITCFGPVELGRNPESVACAVGKLAVFDDTVARLDQTSAGAGVGKDAVADFKPTRSGVAVDDPVADFEVLFSF